MLRLLQKQLKERLVLEDKLRQELEEYFTKVEQEIIEQIDDTLTNKDTLLNTINNRMGKELQDILLKYSLLTMKLTEKQTDTLIEHAKKKRLGQKKSTDTISFKELPITYIQENTKKLLNWISLKAQTNLDNILKQDVINPDAPYKIQPHTQVQKYLEQNTITVSQKTQNRINQDIQAILAKSETEGIGNREVGHLIEERFKKLKTYEAERIARTEINSANNLTAYQRYLNDPLVDYNQWAATNDNRTRDTHKTINGEITRVGHKFSNGLLHPGDKNGPLREFINCRCTLVPWFPDFDMMPPTNMPQFREKDCIPIPTESSKQVVLQLDEDAKLFEVRQGALQFNLEQLGIPSQNKETLMSKLLKNINKTKTTPKKPVQPKQTIKPTDSPEIKQLKKTVNQLTEQIEQNKYKYQFTPEEQGAYDKLMDKFFSNGGKLKLKKDKPILEGGKLNPKEKQQLTKLHEKKLSILEKKPKTTTKSLEQTNTTQKTKKIANVLSTDEQKELKDITQKYNEELNKFKTNNRELYQLIKNNGYSDVLEKELKEKAGVINNKIINKHKDISKISKDSKYQKLKTNQEIADYFGLKYNKKTGVFTDPQSKTKIIFDKYYTEGAGQFLYIDNTNSGKACYDLKEIIRIWYESDDLHKSSVDELRFKYNKSKKLGGEARQTKKGKRIIELYPKALSSERSSDMNLRRAMYHEMNHTLDYMFGLKRGYPKGYGISNDVEFHEAGIKDLIHQTVNGYPICNISSYGNKRGVHEQWADLGSMISCERTDKNSAILEGPEGELIDLDTLKKRCPHSYEYAINKLDELKKNR